MDFINNPGIASASLKVTYDTSIMTLVDVQDMNKLGETVHSNKFNSPYSLNWVNDTIREDIVYNGTAVILKFEINKNAQLGDYSIGVTYNIDNHDIYNVKVQDVAFDVIDGTISVIDTLIGDVNSDGVVNNLDRLVLTRYLANWDGYTLESIDEFASDVNSDGVINNLDRLIITRHLADFEGYEQLPYYNVQ